MNLLFNRANSIKIHHLFSDRAKDEEEVKSLVYSHDISLHGSSGPDRGNVYFKGQPICNDGSWNTNVWSRADATVVCRMLGYQTATDHYNECKFPPCPTDETFIMSGVNCNGDENHINECEKIWDVFGRKGKVISAHLCQLSYLYSVLDKAGSAKVLGDMFESIQK